MLNKSYKSNIQNKIMSKIIKMYKYIDIMEFWYDDDNNPNENTWIDIEGIGYGWLWVGKSKKDNVKELRKMAKDVYLQRNKNLTYICKDKSIYNIILEYKKSIAIIRLSNEKLVR